MRALVVTCSTKQLLRWYDNWIVYASNFVKIEPADELKWWDEKKSDYVRIPWPLNMRSWNMFHGSVNNSAIAIVLYHTIYEITFRIIFHNFNYLCATNSSGMCRKDLVWLIFQIPGSLAVSGYRGAIPKRGRSSPWASNLVL